MLKYLLIIINQHNWQELYNSHQIYGPDKVQQKIFYLLLIMCHILVSKFTFCPTQFAFQDTSSSIQIRSVNEVPYTVEMQMYQFLLKTQEVVCPLQAAELIKKQKQTIWLCSGVRKHVLEEDLVKKLTWFHAVVLSVTSVKWQRNISQFIQMPKESSNCKFPSQLHWCIVVQFLFI